MHRGKSGRNVFQKQIFSQMLYPSQRTSTLQYVVPIELYLFMIFFHFDSQPISSYYKH